MENFNDQTANRVYIALDIDGVLHSLFADFKPEWKEGLRHDNWTPEMFHAAIRDTFLNTLEKGLRDNCLEDDYKSAFLLSQVPILEAVLRRHPEVLIVISSDWRMNLPLSILKGLFPPTVAKRVVGATEAVSEKDEHGKAIPGIRGKLMRNWIRENDLPDDTPWIAIDDGAVLWEGDESRLVHTHFTRGLQPSDAKKLDKMLCYLADSCCISAAV